MTMAILAQRSTQNESGISRTLRGRVLPCSWEQMAPSARAARRVQVPDGVPKDITLAMEVPMADRRDDQRDVQQGKQDDQRNREQKQGQDRGDRGFERQGQSGQPGQGGQQGGQGAQNPRRDQGNRPDEDDEMGNSRNPLE